MNRWGLIYRLKYTFPFAYRGRMHAVWILARIEAESSCIVLRRLRQNEIAAISNLRERTSNEDRQIHPSIAL